MFVAGAPQVLRSSAAREVSVLRGQDAHLKMVVCADPRPTKVQWHWGSLAVDSGANSGRFQAEELLQVRYDGRQVRARGISTPTSTPAFTEKPKPRIWGNLT